MDADVLLTLLIRKTTAVLLCRAGLWIGCVLPQPDDGRADRCLVWASCHRLCMGFPVDAEAYGFGGHGGHGGGNPGRARFHRS